MDEPRARVPAPRSAAMLAERMPRSPASPPRTPPIELADLGGDLRRPVRYATIVVIVLFGIVGAWASTARIAGAVIAPGVVSPEGNRQVVQHLEGGIIRAILVRDGDRVSEGQDLVLIEDLAARADLSALTSQLVALAAEQARVRAERAGTELHFDDPVLTAPGNGEASLAMERERSRFVARRHNHLLSMGILRQRIAQAEQQIVAYEKQIESVTQQQALLREELESVNYLFRQGLERKPRLLALRRSEADNVGRMGAMLASIASARENISALRLQIANLEAQRDEDLGATLSALSIRRRQVEEQIRKLDDMVLRSAVRAPISGTVYGSRFKTPRGVIRAGEAILEIVPDRQQLIIEARVATRDIDEVHPGQAGLVTFPTFPQRHMQKIRATVDKVSADAVADDRAAQPFYLVKASIDPGHLREVAPGARLEPGMPAELYLATRERTVIDYLTYPLRVAMQRAMREQ